MSLFACFGASGCVIQEPQVLRLPPTALDLRVDTTARRPQPMRPLTNPAIPVDTKDQATGRSFQVGPQSRLDHAASAKPALCGRSLPGAGAYLALDTPAQGDDLAVRAGQANAGPETYLLNFDDADVHEVLQSVLGAMLKLSYTVAPTVAGRMTIVSTAAQTKPEILSTLEAALSSQGIALSKVGGIYNVSMAGIGGGTVDIGAVRPGQGISIVPLRYTSAAAMMKLIGGLVAETDSVRVDPALNAVIVRGSAPRRAEIVLAIRSFDVDRVSRQTTSVFELRRAKPEEVAAELSHIFTTENNGANVGLIDIKAVPRLKAVMVSSQTPALVKRAALWIRHLDAADERASRNVYVFRPKFRDARELVKLVKGLFNVGAGEGTDDGEQETGVQQPGLAPGETGETPNAAGSTSSAGSGATAFSSASPPQAQPSVFGSLSTSGSGRVGTVADPIEAGRGGAGLKTKLSLTADASNNTIVAFTDGTTYAQVLSMLRQLDVAPLQVAVNVIIAEVQLNDELKYGVQFFLTHNNKTAGLTNAPTSSANAGSSLSSALQGFNFLLGRRLAPDVVISALDDVSHVEILSSPSLVVMENKPATLQVGDQVPITTRSAQSNLSPDAPTVNSVDYKDTGIILKIKPRVGQDGSVDMEIDQEISAVAANSNSLTPTISKRRISSDIAVLSGQTVLLAGLISDRQQRGTGSVPFLSQAPLVGPLFDSKNNQSARTELVVFIRPVVIRNASGAEAVANEFKGNMKAVRTRQPPVYKQ